METEEKFPEVPSTAQNRSKQLEVAKLERQFRYTKDNLVKPELPLENLVKLYKSNYAHFFCVNIKSACISGVGYRFVAKDFNEQEILGEINALKRRQRAAQIEEMNKQTPPPPPIEDIEGDSQFDGGDETSVTTSPIPEPLEGTGPLTPEEEDKLAELEAQYKLHLANRKILETHFKNINPEESFTNVNSKTDIDKESVGFACWEVIRDNKGRIVEVYHMPAVTVRMMSNNIGVCQVKNSGVGAFGNFNIEMGSFNANSRVFFKKVGLPIVMDARNGQVCGIIDNYGKTNQKVRWINKEGVEDDTVKIDEKFWANEVIIQRKYNPENFWYGMSDIVAALDACAGDKAAAEFQEQFFDNNAVPRMAVIFKGGGFDEEVQDEIQTFFEEDIKGHAHGTLVIEVPGKEFDDHGQEIPASEIVFEKLATEVTDASFRQYRKDNCDQIVTAHRVPGSLLPIQGINFNRDTGMVDLEVFKSQVIRPIQSEREFIINKYIVSESLGITTWEFRFNEIDSLDELRKMQIYRGYIESNVMTLNEVRRELGLPAKKGGDVLFKITPLGLVKIEDIEELSTGDLSAKPTDPLSGSDQGASDGGRPPADDNDLASQGGPQSPGAQNAVRELAQLVRG
ncbi:MAG: phage portal protein [Candidatus Izemoplasmatales bacterium]